MWVSAEGYERKKKGDFLLKRRLRYLDDFYLKLGCQTKQGMPILKITRIIEQ